MPEEEGEIPVGNLYTMSTATGRVLILNVEHLAVRQFAKTCRFKNYLLLISKFQVTRLRY